jgi:feruloyl esterase
VWHGSADTTVKPVNAAEIIKQWTDVHGLSARPTRRETVDGYPRRVWCGPGGEEVIEEYTITGMAHGTPLAAGNDEVGAAGPFLLDVGISSSYHIAKFWGLIHAGAAESERPAQRPQERAPAPNFTMPGREDASPAAAANGLGRGGIEAIISKALRSAGLMK